jgi:hypothetical protein
MGTERQTMYTRLAEHKRALCERQIRLLGEELERTILAVPTGRIRDRLCDMRIMLDEGGERLPVGTHDSNG